MRTSHFCAGLALLCAMVACASEPIENSGQVRYTILSVRPLTDAEKASFQDVAGPNIAVRYRLSNETDHSISYLAESLLDIARRVSPLSENRRFRMELNKSVEGKIWRSRVRPQSGYAVAPMDRISETRGNRT